MSSRRRTPLRTRSRPPDRWSGSKSYEALLDTLRDANAALRTILFVSAGKFGLIPSEYRALSLTTRERDVTPTRVSQWLGITRASTTELIDRLERRGLLVRGSHPSDRRSTILRLTGKGRSLYREARAAYRRVVTGVSRSMSPEGRGRLATGLEEFRRALESSELLRTQTRTPLEKRRPRGESRRRPD